MKFFQILTTAVLAACAEARERVTFESSSTQLVGYHYAPVFQRGPVPAIVIAHGLGGLQSSRLQPYAERFAAAGYHAMTFDYRYWGESAGSPRNLIDVKSQQEDYVAAFDAIKMFRGVDADRIVVWGTSLSGGHALELGARDIPGLAAVIVQAPHVNGPATVSALPPLDIPSKIAADVKDSAGAALGQPPYYIALANRAGSLGLLTQAGALEGYQFIQPNAPAPGNVAPARFVSQLPFFIPDATAANSKLPTYFTVGSVDNVTPPEPAIALAKRMNATLQVVPGAGHFDVYPGKFAYERNVAAQVAFLREMVPI
ncbi:alpha/beta hydrolase like protein [Zymoseptoria brevis]|uniref:Alpha/beta hydrolase like protein n=1 Tax=Zymoseptoria brevis TaxID=1047168 RepID=A0A0F4GST8_9PEZI|nr:alpha/beta hydrolase like protein [Zymoseptoria brevis]